MKIQNTNRRSKISMLAIALAMLAMLACAFTFAVSADTEFEGLPTDVTVDLTDLTIDLGKNPEGIYQRVYDGTTDVTVTLNKTNAELGIAATDDVVVEVTAAFVSKNVVVYDENGNVKTNNIRIDLSLSGADANKYALTKTQFMVGAQITPKKLIWENATVSASTVYQPDSVEYSVPFVMPKLNGLLDADKELLPEAVVALQAQAADATKVYAIQHSVSLGDNYIVDDLTINVVVNPIVITSIEWAEKYEFVHGSAESVAIDIFGLDATGAKYLLKVVYPEKYAEKIGEYTISVEPMSASFVFDAAVATKTAKVRIAATEYQISMNSASYIGNIDTAENPTTYMLSVIGDLPMAIRDKIVYTVDGKPFDGSAAYGVYTIVAEMPSDVSYSFVDANGNKVTQLKATLTINKAAVNATGIDEEYAVIVDGKNGVPAELTATASIPEIAKKAVKKFPNYKAYAVTISNSQDCDYIVKIAVHNDLINDGVLPTVDDLYLYDAAEKTLVKANGDGRKVMLNEGYYEVSGLYGDGEWVFVLAPVYVTNFWLTATGIAIILLLILALIVLMCLVGAKVRRSRENAALMEDAEDEESVEAEEETEEVEETVEEEAPEAEAEEAVLEQTADSVAEKLAHSVEPEQEPVPEADAEKVEEAAEEAIEEFTEELREEIAAEEAAVVEEPVEEEPVAEEPVAEEPVEEFVEETVAETVAEETVEETAAEEKSEPEENEKADTVVIAAMEKADRESEDEKADADEERTVETFAEVSEDAEDADDDNDDDNEDDAEDSFGGFSLSGLDFIDISADPEAYAALLAQEKNGEVQLAYRYRRSYQSRLAQSQGRVQDYYSVLKNALLSYKGVKGRISWNYEAFNKGRSHLAKMNAKTKTLYLYLALDPAELADSKYGIIDVSSKKKYATVPVLLKIKGDRKFKYALELIDKMCAEQMQLPKRANAEDVDYRVPYQTTEELVESGIVKKLVAAVPLTDNEVAASADAAEETTEA